MQNQLEPILTRNRLLHQALQMRLRLHLLIRIIYGSISMHRKRREIFWETKTTSRSCPIVSCLSTFKCSRCCNEFLIPHISIYCSYETGLAKWEKTFLDPKNIGRTFSNPKGPWKAALLSGPPGIGSTYGWFQYKIRALMNAN